MVVAHGWKGRVAAHVATRRKRKRIGKGRVDVHALKCTIRKTKQICEGRVNAWVKRHSSSTRSHTQREEADTRE